MKRLQETLKQVNGTTTPESSQAECSSQAMGEEKDHFTDSANPEDHRFETEVLFQNGSLQSLMVHRVLRPMLQVTAESSDASSEKSGSNGSTTSLGPFALPGALTHTASGLSVSSTSSAGAHPTAAEKSLVQGVSGLRYFLQDLIKKLPEEKKKPVGRGAKARTSSASSAQPSAAAATPATPTRTSAAVTSPKVVESAKKQVAFAASTTTESQVGNFVMARWSDKKYYAGRVSAEKNGKFTVRFEDGAQRTLTKDQLVFGDKNVAAVLVNRECNVLVDANIYETGLVVSIDAEGCLYSVMTNSGPFTVPASDLYLDEDQAKQIQQLESGASAEAPATTASGRRKRNSDVIKSSPEAGPSNEPATKKSRKR